MPDISTELERPSKSGTMALQINHCEAVRIVEVGPRDGLQNIRDSIPTETKIELISRLRKTGLRSIELTSLVSPQAVPQLSDSQYLLADCRIRKLIEDGTSRHPVLVPNMRGLQVAIDQDVREIAVLVSASEAFSRANINCSISEGLARARKVARHAIEAGMSVRGYVSCIFECPSDGSTTPDYVAAVVENLLEMGCYEVSLGDTTGAGTAKDVNDLLDVLKTAGVPMAKLAGHFHDTYGQAVSNIWTAYERGMRVFDSSVAGLGGCPYCPGAKGNASTEDVLYLFQKAGIETGVNLNAVVETGSWITTELGIANQSRVGVALAGKSKPTSNTTPHAAATWTQSGIVDKHARSVTRAGIKVEAMWLGCHLLWRSRHKFAMPLRL
ncbi:hypothetical protein DOTSEDRAFT_69508 [Dothistroma septosporum NZE10]|uniref:hydroxymethylglutaryl-CoA lyase n=1 Tax=Dothistroma septosporum (strain NZE10 / CBS 128990) TaxID=675120 RepID=N1PW35_DOTSN|nr:hypothetical protein DOTSEDRAFT_69508 [Dothistroma septosporum NZE10]